MFHVTCRNPCKSKHCIASRFGLKYDSPISLENNIHKCPFRNKINHYLLSPHFFIVSKWQKFEGTNYLFLDIGNQFFYVFMCLPVPWVALCRFSDWYPNLFFLFPDLYFVDLRFSNRSLFVDQVSKYMPFLLQIYCSAWTRQNSVTWKTPS